MCNYGFCFEVCVSMTVFVARPITSLEQQVAEEFSERGQNFLNYVQYFQTMSNTFFQGGRKKVTGLFVACFDFRTFGCMHNLKQTCDSVLKTVA